MESTNRHYCLVKCLFRLSYNFTIFTPVSWCSNGFFHEIHFWLIAEWDQCRIVGRKQTPIKHFKLSAVDSVFYGDFKYVISSWHKPGMPDWNRSNTSEKDRKWCLINSVLEPISSDQTRKPYYLIPFSRSILSSISTKKITNKSFFCFRNIVQTVLEISQIFMVLYPALPTVLVRDKLTSLVISTI
jgi:hypothetical protein